MPRRLLLPLALLFVSLSLAVTANGAALPVEPYASYDGQTACSPSAKKGTVAMGRYLVKAYGGRFGGIGRSCAGRSTSEHKEGRAFDWMIDARKAKQRARAYRFLKAAFATGPTGQPAELARRMGIMYVIFNDRIYAAYDGFSPRPYRSSSCRNKPLKKCSKTLRHRDHVHISLTRLGANASTSWYVGKVPGAIYVPPFPPDPPVDDPDDDDDDDDGPGLCRGGVLEGTIAQTGC